MAGPQTGIPFIGCCGEPVDPQCQFNYPDGNFYGKEWTKIIKQGCNLEFVLDASLECTVPSLPEVRNYYWYIGGNNQPTEPKPTQCPPISMTTPGPISLGFTLPAGIYDYNLSRFGTPFTWDNFAQFALRIVETDNQTLQTIIPNTVIASFGGQSGSFTLPCQSNQGYILQLQFRDGACPPQGTPAGGPETFRVHVIMTSEINS